MPTFAGLSPIACQVRYVFLTRLPCYSETEAPVRIRLACVRHAASVRSEPGSNSPLCRSVSHVAWSNLHHATRLSVLYYSQVRYAELSLLFVSLKELRALLCQSASFCQTNFLKNTTHSLFFLYDSRAADIYQNPSTRTNLIPLVRPPRVHPFLRAGCFLSSFFSFILRPHTRDDDFTTPVLLRT